MSYRGQQHGQRAYAGKGFDNKNDQRFAQLPPVEIKPYDPVTDVACEIVNVPYGLVFVGGEPDTVRSHEVHLDNKDRSGFIDSRLLSSERRIAREARHWSEHYDRGERTPQRAKELRKAALS